MIGEKMENNMQANEPSAKYMVKANPQDWEFIQLTKAAQLESGHTPSKRAPLYWGGGIPWISLHDTGSLDRNEIYETAKTVTPEGIKNSSARLLPKGTVVFSRTATVGKASIMGREMATSQDFANFICGPKVHNNFLIYLFRHMKPTWKSLMAGSIHNTIYMPAFEKLHVVLPPVGEQQAIATALSDTDALIDALEQLLVKKRQVKQGAMRELLTGEKRLAGFHGEWAIKSLGDCLSNPPEYGINAPAVDFSDQLPTYIRITDITDDGEFRPNPKVSVKTHNLEQYTLKQGDILFTRTGASVGKSYLYTKKDGPLIFAGFLIRVRAKQEELLPEFLFALTKTENYWKWVTVMSMRSGQPGINGNEYKQLPIPVPSIEEQTAIAAILSDMDTDITELETRIGKVRQVKQGMMRELLTGRTRLA